MKTIFKPVVIILYFGFILVGCSSNRPTAVNQEDFVANALEHSKLFDHVKSCSGKSFFMIENDQAEYVDVAVGASTPERFERFGAVRVMKKDARVLKEDYDQQGEQIWVDDTRTH